MAEQYYFVCMCLLRYQRWTHEPPLTKEDVKKENIEWTFSISKKNEKMLLRFYRFLLFCCFFFDRNKKFSNKT